MPTYGCEDDDAPLIDTDETPDMRSEAIRTAVEAALRVRDACNMDLNDAAVTRLVTTALGEYRG